MNSLTSILIGTLAAVLVFVSGYESGKTAERERMNAIVTQEQIKHAKSVAEATNSIVTASNEYDAVRAERDALIERLRKSASSGQAGDSLGACNARVARLEGMVAGLHKLVERCDAGWHGCAVRKDALVETVK